MKSSKLNNTQIVELKEFLLILMIVTLIHKKHGKDYRKQNNTKEKKDQVEAYGA